MIEKEIFDICKLFKTDIIAVCRLQEKSKKIKNNLDLRKFKSKSAEIRK